MIPDAADPTVYHGDVYVLQQGGGAVEGDGEIVGVMQAIKFRRYPRVLLNRFFSAAEIQNPDSAEGATAEGAPNDVSLVKSAPTKKASEAAGHLKPTQHKVEPSQQPTPAPTPKLAAAIKEKTRPSESKTVAAALEATTSSTTSRAMALVAAETGLEASDLKDEATFAEVGVDSLMSLVIAEKLREQLGIAVSGSLFLEYPTVGDLRAWLLEYHS